MSVLSERKYFTVISSMSAFSILEYLDTSFFIASNTRLFSSLRLSFILALLIFSINGFLDFLLSFLEFR